MTSMRSNWLVLKTNFQRGCYELNSISNMKHTTQIYTKKTHFYIMYRFKSEKVYKKKLFQPQNLYRSVCVCVYQL